MLVLIAIPVVLLFIFTLAICNAASDEENDEEQARWCEEYYREHGHRKCQRWFKRS